MHTLAHHRAEDPGRRPAAEPEAPAPAAARRGASAVAPRLAGSAPSHTIQRILPQAVQAGAYGASQRSQQEAVFGDRMTRSRLWAAVAAEPADATVERYAVGPAKSTRKDLKKRKFLYVKPLRSKGRITAVVSVISEDVLTSSQFLAHVAKLQLELPALEGHHHATKLCPGDLPAIDEDCRHAIVVIEIGLDPSTHDPSIVDLESERGLLEVRPCECATHLLKGSAARPHLRPGFDDPPYDEYIGERARMYAELGQQVTQIALRLRRAGGLPNEVLTKGDWSRDQGFAEVIDRFKARRARHEQVHQESTAKLPPPGAM